MTDNQAIFLREVLTASSEHLKRSRELLEASIARRRHASPVRHHFALDIAPLPPPSRIETALRAWQDFSVE